MSETISNNGENPNADRWASLVNGTQPRGKYVKGPDGNYIPEEQLDAAMEAYERAQYYKNNPEAAQHDADQEALDARLKEMEETPDRFDRFEGEHEKGAKNRSAEYTTLTGMYAASPDGTPLNNAARKEMARMMHDAEDLQTFEENEKYADYIAREREKIGTVYKSRDDFNHRIVARLKRLDQRDTSLTPAGGDNSNTPDTSSENQSDNQQSDDGVIRLSDSDVEVIPPDPNGFFKPNHPQITGPTIDDRPPQITGPTIIDQAPQLPGPVQGEKNKVEIGKIDIDTEFVDRKFAEIKSKDLEKVEKELDDLRPKIAELYARNRRLFVGAENRTQFIKNREEYGQLLDKCLRLKAEKTFEDGRHEIVDKIDKRVEELRAEIEKELTEFAGGDLENSEKTQEEIDTKKIELAKEKKEILDKEYGELIDTLKTQVNCEFVADFIKEETELENATVDKLDNGSLCRRFINKVINNKKLKAVLAGAAVAGLAVTGVGLLAGGVSVGIGFTTAGVATGALKGGLSGLLMSRQNSKNSAIHGFANESEIVKQLQEIDVTNQDASTANVTRWLMGQYGDANREDRRSNAKKTAVSAGLGAALGALASGLHFNSAVETEQTFRQQTGTTPVQTQYNVDANIAQVNQPQGMGLYKTMEQMGVPKERWDEALKIAYDIEPKYGLSPGSNGVVPGFNGTIGRLAEAYPGPINTWPDTAQSFITETAEEWARQGLMPAQTITTGGQPIYSTITKTIIDYVPNAFMNFLTRATAVAGAGAIGGAIGGFGDNGNVNRASGRTNRNTPPRPATSETIEREGATTPERGERSGVVTPELAADWFAYYDSLPDDDETASENEPESTDTDREREGATTPERGERSGVVTPELAADWFAYYDSLPDDDETASENEPESANTNSATNPEARTDDSETETDVEFPEDIRNILGTDRMNALLSRDEYNEERDGERYANLWNELPEAIKSQIEDILLNQSRNSESGRTFRQWFSANENANQ